MSTTPDIERLGFIIDGQLKRWSAGGVMSATTEEQALWAEVESLRAQLEAARKDSAFRLGAMIRASLALAHASGNATYEFAYEELSAAIDACRIADAARKAEGAQHG